MYKSEAQAYQAWRHKLKKRRNSMQRRQTFEMWEANTGEPHPFFQRKFPKSFLTNMAKNSRESLIFKAIKYQDKVSECQLLLNEFAVAPKVKTNEKETSVH